MNVPFQVAQLSPQGGKPAKIVKLQKPANGQAQTVQLAYDGSVGVDLSAIANEKITLVHAGERLVILFDNQSTLTLDPFFDSNGAPRPGLNIQLGGGRFVTGHEFATLFPITEDQSVLPAAGPGQAQGANFRGAVVDDLAAPPLNALMPQEELTGLEFAQERAPLNEPPPLRASGSALNGVVEEEHLRFQIRSEFDNSGVPQRSEGNEDPDDKNDLDDDTENPADFDNVTHEIAGNLSPLVTGGAGPLTWKLVNATGSPVLNGEGSFVHSQGYQVFYAEFDAGVAGQVTLIAKAASGDESEGLDRIIFTITVKANGNFVFTLYDQIDHPDAAPGAMNEEFLDIDLSQLIQVSDLLTTLTFGGKVFTISVIDDTPLVNQVQVIDFDDIALAGGAEAPLNTLFPAGYQGFVWGQTGVFDPDTSIFPNLHYAAHSEENVAFFGEASGPPLDIPGYPAPAGSPIVITHTSGADFAFLGAWFMSAFDDNLLVTAEAWNDNTLLKTYSFTVDRDGPFFVDFSGLAEFRFIDELRFDAPNYFGFDNFTYVLDPQYDTRDIPLVVVDEDDIAGVGNNDSRPRDDAQLNADGTHFLGFKIGADEPASIDFASMHLLNVNIVNTPTQVTSGGLGLKWYWNAAANTLYATTNTTNVGAAAANAAFQIALIDPSTGRFSVDMLKKIDHPATEDPSPGTQGSFEDNIDIDVTYTVTDADGDSATGVLHLLIDDDAPVANDDGERSVAEDAAAISGNVMTNDHAGADGATLTHVNPGAGFVTLGSGALQSGGVYDGYRKFTTAKGDYYVKADGSWAFDPALDQGPHLIDASFFYRLTDGDGDADEARQPIVVEDGADPQGGGALALSVEESDLDPILDPRSPAGPADLAAASATGTTPSGDDETKAGTLSFTAGSDSIASVTFADPNLTGNAVAIDSGVEPGTVIVWSLSNSDRTLTGKIGGVDAIILQLSGPQTAAPGASVSPTITVTLTDDFPHEDGPPDAAQLVLSNIKVVAAEADGNSAVGTVSVTVVDDEPVVNQVRILTFDDGIVLSDGGEAPLNAISTNYGGFTWAQTGVYNPVPSNLGYATHSEPNLAFIGEKGGGTVDGYPGNPGDPIVIERPDEVNFTFLGAWFSAVNSDDLPITVTGFDDLGAVVATQTVIVDRDGPTFFSFTGFDNLDKLTFQTSNATTGNYFGFDNFTYVLNAQYATGDIPLVVVDEDDIAGVGNNDSRPRDDAQLNADGTYFLGFKIGADEPASIDFASMHLLNVNIVNTPTQVTSGGLGLKWYWNAGTHTLYATTTTANAGAAAANAAFKIVLIDPATGRFSVDMLKKIDHPATEDPSLGTQGSFEDNVDIDVTYTVTDADGDSAAGVLHLSVDDDIPVVDFAGPANINEGQTATGGTYTLKPGADGLASGTLKFFVGSTQVGAVNAGSLLDGETITLSGGLGTVTVNAPVGGVGSWSLAAGSVTANTTIRAVLTAADGDGDTASASHEITILAVNDPLIVTSGPAATTILEDASFTPALELIANGGFETFASLGNHTDAFGGTREKYGFAGWTVAGDPRISIAATSAEHSGDTAAVIGINNLLPDLVLSQTVTTELYKSYQLSFALANSFFNVNDFTASWNGQAIVSLLNVAPLNASAPNPSQFTVFDRVLDGTGAPAQLAFAFDNDRAYWFFDSVSFKEQITPGQQVRSGLITFTDPDVLDSYTVSVNVGGSGYLGTFNTALTNPSGGNPGRVNWSYTVNEADLQFLGAGANLVQTYTVRISDATFSAFQNVTITLQGVNDAPTDIALTNASIAENNAANAIIGTLSSVDPDSASFTYGIVGGTGQGLFNISGNQLRANAPLDFETAPSLGGGLRGWTVDIRTTDDFGAARTETFTVTVSDVANEPPAAGLGPFGIGRGYNAHSAFSPHANQTIDLAALGVITDPESQPLTWSSANLPSQFWTLTSSGLLTFNNNVVPGIYSMTVSAFDGTGSASRAIEVWVAGSATTRHLIGSPSQPAIGNGNDTIIGNGNSNNINAQGGDDFIDSAGQNDQVNGGAGNDVIYGGNNGGILDDFFNPETLNGGDGRDYLNGEAGTDIINGGNDGDYLVGGGGDDFLRGDAGNDVLLGGTGADELRGGSGLDTLIGGTGADDFRFDATAEGRDLILDFASGDELLFDDAAFGAGLSVNDGGSANTGQLDANRFVANASGFTDAAQRFWFNTGNGVLTYDADGSGGAQAAVEMARLENGYALTAGDIRLF